jgi:hypothetical protein
LALLITKQLLDARKLVLQAINALSNIVPGRFNRVLTMRELPQ